MAPELFHAQGLGLERDGPDPLSLRHSGACCRRRWCPLAAIAAAAAPLVGSLVRLGLSLPLPCALLPPVALLLPCGPCQRMGLLPAVPASHRPRQDQLRYQEKRGSSHPESTVEQDSLLLPLQFLPLLLLLRPLLLLLLCLLPLLAAV